MHSSQRGQWMDCRCGVRMAVRRFIHCSMSDFGVRQARAMYILLLYISRQDLFRAHFASFYFYFFCLRSSSVSLSYFILAVPMRKCKDDTCFGTTLACMGTTLASGRHALHISYGRPYMNGTCLFRYRQKSYVQAEACPIEN